jgi:hypothetical protein
VKRNLFAFAAVFALSAALVAALNGCDTECKCAPTPPRPEAQEPLPGLEIRSYDSSGNYAQLPVSPEDGTIEVTGDTVVIVYRQAGVQHRVVYDVTGPRWPQ